MPNSEGIERLLDMDGWHLHQGGGYWVKIEAHKVKASMHIPHGVKYSLTLHDNHNRRVMGYDNAHIPKVAGGEGFKVK